MNPGVDKYLIDGCMRCKFGGTPRCKVNDWRGELELLRELVLECNLTEEIKWGVPCYTLNGKNVLVISAFREYACLSFFKGVLINDTHSLLVAHGENSQSTRLIKFTNPEQILDKRDLLKEYIHAAIDVERSGKKVVFKSNPKPLPDELIQKFEDFPALKSAFYALTPGKQRGYILYFSESKKPETRRERIEKYAPKILNGEGLHDAYRRK